MADSTFIIEYLKATYGDKHDAWLSTEQRAVALAPWTESHARGHT
jgi:hypothetical protein